MSTLAFIQSINWLGIIVLGFFFFAFLAFLVVMAVVLTARRGSMRARIERLEQLVQSGSPPRH